MLMNPILFAGFLCASHTLFVVPAVDVNWDVLKFRKKIQIREQHALAELSNDRYMRPLWVWWNVAIGVLGSSRP
jgi:hypothetical protein